MPRINFLFVLIILLTACSPEVVASPTQTTYPTEAPTTIPSPTATEAPTEVPPTTPTEVPPVTAEDLMKNTITVETPGGPVIMPEVQNLSDALKIAIANARPGILRPENDATTLEDNTLFRNQLGKVNDGVEVGNFGVRVTRNEDRCITSEDECITIFIWSKEPGATFVFYKTDPDPVTNLTFHPIMVRQDAEYVRFLFETGQYVLPDPEVVASGTPVTNPLPADESGVAAEDLEKITITMETPGGSVTMPEVDNLNEALKIVAEYGTDWNESYGGDKTTQEDYTLMLNQLGKVRNGEFGDTFNVKVTGNEDQYINIVIWSKDPGATFVFYRTDPDPVTNLTFHPMLVRQHWIDILYRLQTGQYVFPGPEVVASDTQ